MAAPRCRPHGHVAAGIAIALAVVVMERTVTAAVGAPDAAPVAVGLAGVIAGVSVFWGRRAPIALQRAVWWSAAAATAAVGAAIVVGVPGRLSPEVQRGVRIGLIAAALGLLLALALRPRLTRMAARLVHGDGGDPQKLLDAWAGRMTRALPLDELVLQLAEALAKALSARSVEVWTGSDGHLRLTAAMPDRAAAEIVLGSDAAASAARAGGVGAAWARVWAPALLAGRDDALVLRIAPVAHRGTLLGLVVVERDDEDLFSEAEDRMLIDAARRLALALHNSVLDSALGASLEELRRQAAELAASRRRVVQAADDAARRIERNLHDGAQQHLVTLAVKLSLARALLRSGPEEVDPVLAQLQGDVDAALEELRTLAQGIYPPVLVERGLGEALRAAATRSRLPVDVDVALPTRPPTDVEAAAYFCCVEALQNAAKHAGPATLVRVSVAQVDGTIAFRVIDDGAGFDASTTQPGGGLVHLTDRVGAVGGVVSVRSTPGQGTEVSGHIPLPR